MSTPFFSIVIPTRNRPQLFKEALQSALLQDFDDFEVVVSNNSINDDTLALTESFGNNPRLSVFRPNESLSMPEHWEFASQKARGRYVLILTDRSVLKRHALKTIHAAICSSEQDVLVCSWRWSVFNDDSNLELVDIPLVQKGEILKLASQDVAQSFTTGEDMPSYTLPRALNSCYRQDLANEIRAKHGALFVPIAPDYTSAFLLLAYAEHVLFLDTALFISQGTRVSNGGGSYHSISAGYEYINSLSTYDCYAHVPLKVPLVESLLFEDFLAIQEKAGGNLQDIVFNWPYYFVSCYRELITKKANERDVTEEHATLMLDWDTALLGFDNATQQEVKRRVARLNGIRNIKNFLKATPLGPLILYLNRWLEVHGKKTKTALDHAGFGGALHIEK